MKESARLTKSITDIYNGNPWLDANLADTLHSMNAATAAKKLVPNCNSIWEITNHIIDWRLNVLERLKGTVIQTPDHNYFHAIEDKSEQAWNNTLNKLEDSQQKWLMFLDTFTETSFDNIYPVNGMTYYDHVEGIVQHDAYHLGQILLLAKLLRLQDSESFV